MISITVAGESEAEIQKDIELLARAFGVTPAAAAAIVGNAKTVIAEEPKAEAEEPKKRRGRPKKEETVAPADDDPFAPSTGGEDDPFAGSEEEEESEALSEEELKELRKKTLTRLQRLYTRDADTVGSLMSKHGKGVIKKAAELPMEVFPALARDLDVLNA